MAYFEGFSQNKTTDLAEVGYIKTAIEAGAQTSESYLILDWIEEYSNEYAKQFPGSIVDHGRDLLNLNSIFVEPV